MLNPVRDQLEIFVEAMFRHASSGTVALRSFYEDRSEPFQIVPLPINGGNLTGLIDLAEKMAGQAANATERVVFCPPIATFRNGRRATEADLEEGLALSVECDTNPQQARARLEQILGPATVVIRSGGVWTDPQTGAQADKLHLHWRLAEPATGKALTLLKQARAAATRLAGGDSSNIPVVHPIRWPGSWHRKAEPRLCTIESTDPDRELVLELALDALETAAPAAADGAANGGTDSNSERRRIEWGDAFRQILSGDSYHPTLTPLAASMAAWGAPEPVTDNVLRCLLINSQPADTERAQRRDAELGKLPETVRSAYAKYGDDSGKPEGPAIHWYGTDQAQAPARDWLVDGLLPQTGIGLISGQWGSYKTFVALDLAAAIMAGLAFIDYPVGRRGGVLFVAVEGAGEIPIRLEAVHKEKYPDCRLPFAWIDECPRLLGPNAVDALAKIADEVAERMQKEFAAPLALIVVDTVIDAAGYAKPGDENDATLGQQVMRRMGELARRTGALVLGIDHFGKAVETGTRGSSAKEGRADVVLALLGDKSVAGEVTNTRLAVRKNRAGPAGQEHPFTVKVVELGSSEREVSSLVIQWGGQKAAEPDESWSKSLRLLRRVLMDLLASDQAKNERPFVDGPVVRAIDLELIRGEFHRQYPATGDEEAKRRARKEAFRRAIVRAQEQGRICIRDSGGVTLVWLATSTSHDA